MTLRIFFCTLGRSRKLAKNWDREKLKLQSTPDNSNLQGKSKKVRVIGSSKKIAGSKEKNSFYCTVSILTLPCALRSHDYHHVTGSANQKRRHANKIQKKEGKIKQIE